MAALPVMPATSSEVSTRATPKYLRDMLREQFGRSTLKFLTDTMSGDIGFPRIKRRRRSDLAHDDTRYLAGDSDAAKEMVEIVEIDLPTGDQRLAAAFKLVEVMIPKQAGIADDDGNMVPGVIVLGSDDVERIHSGESAQATAKVGVVDDAEYEVVYEDVTNMENRSRDEAPRPMSETETVDPAVAAAILRRRQNGNGRKG